MTVEGTLSEREFVRLNRWLFYRKPAVLLLHLAAAGLGLYWSTRPDLGVLGAVLPGAPLLLPAGLYLLVGHRARGVYRGNRTLQAPLRYTLGEEGLTLETPTARALLAWDRITGVSRTPGHLLVYGAGGEAFLLSRSWFTSAEVLRAFEAGLRRAPESGESGGCPSSTSS